MFCQVLRGYLHSKRSNLIDNQGASVFDLHRTRFRWVARMWTVCLYVLTVSPLIWTTFSAAAEYHGMGYVDYRAFSSDTNQADHTIFKERWNFVFGASNDVWRIHLDDPENGMKVEYTYDGTNTYVIIPTGTNIAAQIFPTQYPPPNGFPAIVVWFAYCSGAYISSATNNLLCSLSQEAHPYVTAYGRPVRSELEFLDTALHIPRKCLEFSDGALYGIDVKKRPPVVLKHKFGGAFSNGFVEAAYSVGETTNAGGLTLPKTFQLQQFRPREGSSSSNDVFVLAEFSGSLQSVEVGALNIGDDVQIQHESLVDDYRGMKLDPPVELVQYFSPSKSWLPFSPGSMPYAEYEIRKRVQAAETPRSYSNRRAYVVAFLVALTVIPLIGIGVQRFFRRTSVDNH